MPSASGLVRFNSVALVILFDPLLSFLELDQSLDRCRHCQLSPVCIVIYYFDMLIQVMFLHSRS